MIYATYTQNGIMRRAILSERQYELYLKDQTINNFQIHGSQKLMENYFNETNNISKPSRKILYG